ncbi:ATP-binding domain-containing protein [Sulfurimonas sp. NWX79]|uniref:DEAD/DEAH box helicase n=1 Tax=Sulfurimonas sp. NWX79 TaxID=2925412 RepID=UPI003204FABA
MEKIIATEIQPEGIDSTILDYLEKNSTELRLENAIIYYGFPIFKDYDDVSIKARLVILSPYHGLILLYPSSEDKIIEDDESLEQLYSFIETSLKRSKIIRINKRNLAIPLDSFLYLSTTNKYDELENNILTSLSAISETLKEIELDKKLEDNILNESRSIIEGSKALSKTTKREKVSEDPTSKSNILIELEKEISNFDEEQRKIAISLINGPQRIRGLAGSGKTIVLAMKVANIHLQYPNKKILFTFYTKSLYNLIKELITKFYWHYAGTEPNWDLIDILHSWGGRSIDGVAYNACIDNSLEILSFKEAKKISSDDVFQVVCNDIIQHDIQSKYDYILIDEAQDLPNEFFKLCYQLAHGENGNGKNIVWAYDELQSIFNVYQRTPQELFGNDSNGEPCIDLSLFQRDLHATQKNDLVLYKCYRNPLEVLITAHALGFGLYSPQHVQKLEDANHWRDVGYTVEGNQSFDIGDTVTVRRDKENSPLSIYNYQKKEDIIQCYQAEDLREECHWIADKIEEAIKDGLKPQDLLVIVLDDRYVKAYFSKLSLYLSEKGIRSNNLQASTLAAPPFSIKDMVTLSTVHKAKGNEAAMVFAAGLDALYSQRNTIRGRNKLFTAFTRTKAWLRVSGAGENINVFFDEIKQSLDNSPNLRFTIQEIRTIQRDLDTNPQEMKEFQQMILDLKKKGYSKEQLKMLFEKDDIES